MSATTTHRKTQFLGWDAPLLPAVVDLLSRQKDEAPPTSEWDLSGAVFVLPTARGATRLRQLLWKEAERRDWALKNPQLITVGRLDEYLYRPIRPVALDFEQTLAWAKVLREAGSEKLSPIVPTPPPAEPIGPWLELAGTVRRLRAELASSRLDFSDVRLASETDSEKRRWQALCDLDRAYQATIAEADLTDPHQQREQAVREERCRCRYDLYMIGTSDLSDIQIAMLRSVEGSVSSFVAAPVQEAHRFNEFGSVISAHWVGHQLPLQDDHLISADDVHDQSAAASECLAEFGKRHRVDEVTVGVTD